MNSDITGASAGSPLYCGTCGRPLTADLTACPNCGTPVAMGASASAPLATSDLTVPSAPTWHTTPANSDAQAPTWQVPAAIGASAAKPRRGRRALVMGGIASLLVVALLATGVAYVLGAFAGHSELDAAKYLPANTFAFSGVDVYSLAENSHNISLNSLVQGSGGGSLTSGTGLDWTNDVLPWLGRDVAAAAFPAPAGSTATASSPVSPVSGVVLIQSHDDTKALAAMKKAADNGVSGGATTSSYSGFTLYSQPQVSSDFTGDASTTLGTTFTAGKGWAMIATDPATAKVVIDRLNGTGDTLANQQGFQNATDNLPGNRFGTVYVDLQAITSLAHIDSTAQVQQILKTYPIGVGYTSWTDAGLHAQVTFNATKGAGIQYPAGDASALASAVPSNAYAYVSIGNLGGDLRAGASQLGSDSTSAIAKALGVPLTDPALQQPAALAVFPTSTGSIGGALLLKAPDASAATSFLQAFATANNCTLAAATGTDASAQALACPAIDLSGLGLGGTDVSGLTGDAGSLPTPPILVEQTNGVMVFALDDGSLQAVTSALGGGTGLASNATFKSLVGQAPSGAQSLTFVSITAFTSVIGSIASIGSGASATATPSTSPIQPTALLISSVSDSSKTEVSIDLALK